MKTNNTLNCLSIGESATVTLVRKCCYAARLNEMGLLPGRRIVLMHQAPFSGPFAIGIGSQTIALRREEAEQIEVSRDE
ncbi:MAG: ferrous iron transport protein A [Flavobacteriales bacterium]